MKLFDIKKMTIAATFFIGAFGQAQAAIIISEVAPWGSGNGDYAADWFELTNTGSVAMDITGWKMDDNSNSFASAVALRGVSSLAAGQSAIFIESNSSGSNDASINSNFMAAWFGASVPVGFAIGNYGGSGVGLSTNGDAVNIFNAVGNLVTRVDFGSSTAGVSFDNADGLNNTAISLLSSVGTNGAFTSHNGLEIGSPGTVSPVPVPAAVWLMGTGLLGLLSAGTNRKQQTLQAA